MRARYRQDKTTLELKPAEDFSDPNNRYSSNGPNVMGDIKPYHSIITGELITSRSKHRSHLKEHNCIEVGSEKPSFMKE